MMRDSLKKAAESPYFQLTMSVGINNLLAAAKILSSIGIDVNHLITQALQSINEQLTDAAYSVTDLDELLKQAQAIGDEEVVETQSQEAGNVTPTKESGDSSKGNFGKPE
jgi:hypothetical protein